ncbi:MAG: DsrE family protein [Erythrobacter sp.]|uniref:DsrE family protein n=1 Tax=Erythrobacter sp. TaxID=1042 RepID=UPI0032972E41
MKALFALPLALLLVAPLSAQSLPSDDFAMGPVFKDHGPNAEVAATVPIPAGTVFKVAFDAEERSAGIGANRTLVSAMRLINMHTRAGVPVENTKVAVVVHGSAVGDLLNVEAYAERYDGTENPTAQVLQLLLDHDVKVIVCGQSAAAQGIDETSDFVEDVDVALSAMTAHALLQQDGYTVNPF